MYLPRESAQCYTLCGIDVGLGRFSSAWLNNQPSQSIWHDTGNNGTSSPAKRKHNLQYIIYLGQGMRIKNRRQSCGDCRQIECRWRLLRHPTTLASTQGTFARTAHQEHFMMAKFAVHLNRSQFVTCRGENCG
jgi:hypothetical protein